MTQKQQEHSSVDVVGEDGSYETEHVLELLDDIGLVLLARDEHEDEFDNLVIVFS